MDEAAGELIGKVLGNWKLCCALGAGAFGSVYEAEHTMIEGRKAAVKTTHACGSCCIKWGCGDWSLGRRCSGGRALLEE